MMIKKKLGVLAGAVLLASSAQAAFDTNAVLYAWDSADNDTYFVDLGVSAQAIVDGTNVSLVDSGLEAFLAANAGSQWTIIGSINDTDLVGGPPAAGQSLANSGVVSTSLSGSAVGTDGTTNDQQRLIMNDWLADIEAASGGSSSFGVAGTAGESADPARNAGFFNDSLTAVGDATGIFYSQADPASGALLSDANVITQVGVGGVFTSASTSELGVIAVTAVPVPAAAWLFGSALAGLTVIRRRK
jgi:hypothetical protein